MPAVTDLALLRARADAGDAASMRALGKRLLVGEGVPAAPQDAIAMIGAAAARDGEAAALMSVFAAWGVLQPRDFTAALRHLHSAAALGWAAAEPELRLLQRDGSSIDLDMLSRPPPPDFVSEAPRIAVFRNFATADECDWLIARGAPSLRRARVYQGSADLIADDARTNREADFTVFNADLAIALIRARMEAAIGAPSAHFEITKLLHYTPGQTFALHADFFETTTPALQQEIARRGQRVATLLVYLNESYEDGETDFPRINFRFKGAKGDALLFANVDADGAPDYRTLHAGLPPSSGEKWLLSQWIRSRPVVA